MFRTLAVAAIAWLSLGFPAPFNARVKAPLLIEPSDTLILTSRAPADSIVRVVLPLGDLKANFELRTRWLNIYADTLELPSPAVLVMKDQSFDIRLASRPGDPVLRLAFSYPVANASTRAYCIAEGSTLRLTRAAGEARPYVLPNRTLECVTR